MSRSRHRGPNGKLSDDEVRELRRLGAEREACLRRARELSCARLAAERGLSRAQVWRVISYQNYRYVED